MHKKIVMGILSLLLMTGLTACDLFKSEEEKYDDILDAYLEYFRDEVAVDYASDECGAKIVLDKDDFPVMIAGAKTGDTWDTMLYTYDDGEVVTVKSIYDKSYLHIHAYADGIFAIGNFDKPKFYQLSGTELISIDDIANEAYENVEKIHNTYIPGDYGDTLEAEELYGLESYILSEEFYTGKDKENYITISNSVNMMFDEIYNKLYEGNIDVLVFFWTADKVTAGHFLSSPLISMCDDGGLLPASDFRGIISGLKERGIMSQDEFMIWNINYYIDTYGGEVMKYSLEGFGIWDIILRNPLLLSELDVWIDEADEDDVKMCITQYAFFSNKPELLASTDVTKDITQEEVKYYIYDENVYGILTNYIHDMNDDFEGNIYQTSIDETLSELLREYADKNITGTSNEEIFQACKQFYSECNSILEDLSAEALVVWEQNAWKEAYISYFNNIDSYLGCYVFKVDGMDIPYVLVPNDNLYHYENGYVTPFFEDGLAAESVAINKEDGYVYLEYYGRNGGSAYLYKYENDSLNQIEHYWMERDANDYPVYYDSKGNQYTDAEYYTFIRENHGLINVDAVTQVADVIDNY